jgi:NADH-quinone oxidoreductase subunit J
MAAEMVLLLLRGARPDASAGAPPPGFSNTKALGHVLYTDYVYAFELAAIVLLVAIVAAIAITLRSRKETKYQDAATQLAATKGGRPAHREDGARGARGALPRRRASRPRSREERRDPA